MNVRARHTLNCVPWNSHVEALPLTVPKFGDEAIKKGIKVK
jgi:hypothetical protein